MSTTAWLRRQIKRLENEIRDSTVFEVEAPASRDELHALRAKVVLHRYLKQQLLRRARTGAYDTKELELAPVPHFNS
jgi:hypothetical protein